MASFDYDTIVIGAGASGLVIANGLARAGKEVLLIDKHLPGGDCTHYGCIPSKSLIAAAKQKMDATQALAYARSIVAKVAKEETPKVLVENGIHYLRASASFVDPHTLACSLFDGGIRNVTGRRIVIATGSRPTLPNIECSGYLTNETIFSLRDAPSHLAILGSGPIACELAMAFAHLGVKVTLLARSNALLRKEEKEVQILLRKEMEDLGITLRFNAQVTKIEATRIEIEKENAIEASHVLVAIGRTLNIDQLGLPHANVYFNEHGIKIDRAGRTTQNNIYAVGDVTGVGLYTHVAEYQARALLKTLLIPFFRFSIGKRKALPHVTFTSPEIASVGLTEENARKQYGRSHLAIYYLPIEKIDRALTESISTGFIKVVTRKWSSRILGATIVGPRAGELIAPISIAIDQKMALRKFSSQIFPYPTYGQGIRKIADLYFTQTLFRKK